jgi:hypothetical protein
MPQQARELAERRVSRSNDVVTSLSRLFDATRRSAGLDAVVLTDDTGLMVAGSGAFQLCEELAAEAAHLGHGTGQGGGQRKLSRLSVRRIRVDGISALLCSLGDEFGSTAELDRAVAGCARILGTPLGRPIR